MIMAFPVHCAPSPFPVGQGQGWGGLVYLTHCVLSIRLSCCSCVRFCSDDNFWIAQPFFNLTWYGGVLSWDGVSYRKTDSLFSCLRSQRGLFLLYLLNRYFGFNQTWFDSTVSKAGVFCEKKEGYCVQGQGHSEGSKYICPDDIFWIAEHFVTKLGMVM